MNGLYNRFIGGGIMAANNREFREKQIKSVISSVDERFDKYSQLNIDNCDKSLRKSIHQWSSKPFKSPLGFGDVVVTKPFEASTRNVCFGIASELLTHVVKNVYGGKFTEAEGLDLFEEYDGNVEELLKRLYPANYYWLYDRYGGLPSAGSFFAPLRQTPGMEYINAPSAENRRSLIRNQRDVMPEYFYGLRRMNFPSLDGDTRYCSDGHEGEALKPCAAYDGEGADYWDYLVNTTDEDLSEEERKDKREFVTAKVLSPSDTKEYEEMKQELREYMTEEEKAFLDGLEERRKRQAAKPYTPADYNGF